MTDIARHDRNQAGADKFGRSVDGHLKLALDHFVDLVLRMKALVNGRPAREIGMREGMLAEWKKRPFHPGNRSMIGRLLVSTNGMRNSFDSLG